MSKKTSGIDVRRYKKLPVEISAVRLPQPLVVKYAGPQYRMYAQKIVDWINKSGGQAALTCAGAAAGDVAIRIATLEGVMIAYPGDVIIQWVNGEFYPCKSDIFDKTYESA